jgi:hypothetical protein
MLALLVSRVSWRVNTVLVLSKEFPDLDKPFGDLMRVVAK